MAQIAVIVGRPRAGGYCEALGEALSEAEAMGRGVH